MGNHRPQRLCHHHQNMQWKGAFLPQMVWWTLAAALPCLSLLVDGFSLSMTSSSSNGVVIIAGATGYIGKACVRESIRQGYHTVALIRDVHKVQYTTEGQRLYGDYFEGAEVIQCDVSDPMQVLETLECVKRKSGRIDAVVSCLASRSGIKREAYDIDYRATLHCLQAGMACGADHFVLLSAICVRKPLLQFQQAKLKFEAALQAQNSMTYTIVRPTAFFKSVSGQLERLQNGKPFLMFQDTTRCNPIAESDLATYLIDSIHEPSRRNQIINLGGPDKPMTKIEQGEMIFRAIRKEAKYARLPVWIFDVSIQCLQFLADIFQSEPLENAAELGRIGKYYAVEDMVEYENRYGTITLQEYFHRIACEGQEIDPYTSMTGILGLLRKDELNEKEVVDMTRLQPQLSLAPNSTVSVGSSRRSATSAAESAY